MITGTAFVSTLMKGIYEATANGNSGLGGSMFVIFAEEAYIGPTEDKTAVLDAFRSCSLEDYLSGKSEFSYYNVSKVTEFFKLNKFNFFLGLVGSISVVVLLSLTLLSFVERVISLIVLFVIAPLPMSASSLDDGERFKIWREQTINKFITAYGGILALNIFALMLPMIAKINFFPLGGTGGNVVNGIARLLFIIGGAFACRRGMVLIGNLVSRGAGSQELMDQSHLSGGMASLAHMAGGFVKGAFGLVTGAAKSGINSARTVANAAGLSTSVADVIRQQNAKTESLNAKMEADRFNSKPDYGRFSNSANLGAVIGGAQNTQAPTVITPPADTIGQASGSGSSSNNETNNEMNKEAQNDIKNALQNKKSADNSGKEKEQ